MLYSLRTIFASACLMAAALVLSSQQASAGLNPNPVFGSNAASATGWLAGGHAGYNWQQGATVFGFETDIQGTHLNSSMNGGLNVRPPPPPGSFAMTTASIDYYATFRGRFGFTTGQWLFFGTGGAAYGNVNLSSQFGTLGVMTASDISQPKFGVVVGAGFEYMLRPNLTFNFNYQYVDLGRVGIASS